jgi:hypothetical protein
VTPAARRLCAIAALFAPERASALLGRLGEGAPEAAREAVRLVAAARRERLAALGEVLSLAMEEPGAEGRGGPYPERPRVAELLAAVRAGAPAGGAAPALVRLCLELPARLGAAAAPTCRRP